MNNTVLRLFFSGCRIFSSYYFLGSGQFHNAKLYFFIKSSAGIYYCYHSTIYCSRLCDIIRFRLSFSFCLCFRLTLRLRFRLRFFHAHPCSAYTDDGIVCLNFLYDIFICIFHGSGFLGSVHQYRGYLVSFGGNYGEQDRSVLCGSGSVGHICSVGEDGHAYACFEGYHACFCCFFCGCFGLALCSGLFLCITLRSFCGICGFIVLGDRCGFFFTCFGAIGGLSRRICLFRKLLISYLDHGILLHCGDLIFVFFCSLRDFFFVCFYRLHLPAVGRCYGEGIFAVFFCLFIIGRNSYFFVLYADDSVLGCLQIEGHLVGHGFFLLVGSFLFFGLFLFLISGCCCFALGCFLRCCFTLCCCFRCGFAFFCRFLRCGLFFRCFLCRGLLFCGFRCSCFTFRCCLCCGFALCCCLLSGCFFFCGLLLSGCSLRCGFLFRYSGLFCRFPCGFLCGCLLGCSSGLFLSCSLRCLCFCGCLICCFLIRSCLCLRACAHFLRKGLEA